MNILCIADAYITPKMMEEGVAPYLKAGDTCKVLFFGEDKKSDMRDAIKAIEARNFADLTLPEGLDEEIAKADLVIVHLCPLIGDTLRKAVHLKAIMSCRGGKENIDIDVASELGIIVATNPAHNANAVAEYTVGMILCETRNIARADESLKKGVWRENYPNTVPAIRELKDMTVGIIGFGSVGRLVAKLLAVFGCKILVYDPFISESAYDFISYKFVDLDTLLTQADIISVHARTSKYIIDFAEFAKMKPTAYIVNTARSIAINPAALEDALENKKIMGAAIDVFESEPVIPEFYRRYDNVTITNHRAGDTINSYKDAPAFAMENYLGFLDGEKLRFWVNKDQLSK